MRRNNFANNRGGSGPLMTDHLQDLELELELLKRKRQLIQQQQSEMLYRNPVENRLTYGHHVVQPFENRYNDHQRGNFSNLYDEGPRVSRPMPMAPKRQAQPDWAGPSADRFGPSPNTFKRARPGPNSSNNFNQSPNPRPLLSQPKPFLNPSPQNRRQPPAFRNTPPKRPAPRPNQPAFKRNKPTPPNASKAPKVSGAQKPYYGTPKEILVPRESRKPVLSDAVEPSHKVNGRLELALGNIVKYIKESRTEAAPLFKSPMLARLMKKGIRERVRSAMLGKVVGTVPEIVEEYRKMFPPATDADILELAKIKTVKLSEKAELAIELFEEGDPEQFFKKNLKRLLDVKLDEMFKTAGQKAEESTISEAEILENLPEIKKSHEDLKLNDKKSDEDVKDEGETSKEDAQDENPAKEDTEEVKEKEPTPVLPKNEEYEKWLSKLIERMLPRLLPKFKDYIIKFLDMDKMYSETKAAIITHSNNAALKLAMSQDSRRNDAGKGDPILPTNLPYFVKVQSLPSMPKKKLMQDFLQPFNPKTIKRHKKNYNLLFVGFANKEDYDKILQANQSKIGTATLTIVGTQNTKPSLFDNDNQNEGTNGNEESNGNGETKEEAENKEDDESDILTPQLDDQINDLLSSIKKADEESKETELDETKETTETQEAKQSTETPEVNNAEDDVQIVENTENGAAETEAGNGKDSDVEEVKASDTIVTVEDDEVAPLKTDEVAPLKSDEVKELKGTPAKGKAPATPSTIRTRRASRLAQNN